MKNLYIILSFILMISLNSCNKALDIAPDGKISTDDIFQDEVKVGALINTCYNNIPIKGTRYYFWNRGPVVWSDEAWDTDAEAEPTLPSGRTYNGAASPSDHPATAFGAQGDGDYWARYWTSIRNCTLFIGRIDKANVPTLDKDGFSRKNRWKAEARVLRAYYYSELLKWFGPVLPVEREIYDFTADFSTVKKESYYDVVKFIIEDCDLALKESVIDFPFRYTEPGRVNRALAEAIKAKMILFVASPLNNGGKDYWEEAYQVSKASLANLRSAGFELYKTLNIPASYNAVGISYFGPAENGLNYYASVYNEYFTQTRANTLTPLDRETIFQSKDGQGNIWNIDGIGAQDGYKSGTCPSQELVDAYETTDGQPILDLESPYLDEKHTQPNYNVKNTLYNPNDPYANRDPRFYASIYYNGSTRRAFWSFAEITSSPENFPGGILVRPRKIMTYVGEPQTGIHATTRKATRTGYFERKFLHPSSGSQVNTTGGANWKFFRLGEVILDFAEAAAEAGHLTDAESAVNEIRARVNMPAIPTGLSRSAMILRVRQERRVELAMEENRYFDVRRWTLPTGDLSKTDKWITAMEINKKSDGSFTYTRRPVRPEPRNNYSNKWLRLPIPLSEANRLLGITGTNWQNSGW